MYLLFFFFFQAEDGIRDLYVTGVQTCALPISVVPSWDRAPIRPIERLPDSYSRGAAVTVSRIRRPSRPGSCPWRPRVPSAWSKKLFDLERAGQAGVQAGLDHRAVDPAAVAALYARHDSELVAG